MYYVHVILPNYFFCIESLKHCSWAPRRETQFNGEMLKKQLLDKFKANAAESGGYSQVRK